MNTKSLLTKIAVPVLGLGLLGGTAVTLAGPASAAVTPNPNTVLTISNQPQAEALMAQGGIINKGIDVPAGSDVSLRYVDVHGNTTVEGKLSLASSTMEGNVTVSGPAAGLSLFNDPGNTIWGSLNVLNAGGYYDGGPNTSLGVYSNGQQVNGGLTFTGNGGRLYVGGTMHVNGKFIYSGNVTPYTPSDVTGLTVGGSSNIS
jgi:hypothetical protein